MAPHLLPQAIELVKRHQDAGDLVAIVTATNEFVTRPIADAFGVQELIAVELQRDEAGRVTGRIHGVPTFQAGKIQRVLEWLQQREHSWEQFDRITFYSDSPNDLPLLEKVSHPVATNPSPALEKIARERGWPILKLFE
jgi:HAD superfamily hydrolase (TIGR01490 family)